MTLYEGDSLEILKNLPDNSIDSVCCDPPYGLGKEPDAMEMLKAWMTEGHYDVKGSGFMGKKWDAFVPQPELWKECLRVLKPGGHLVAFAGTRTMDLMALGLRIAGFELRDSIGYAHEDSNGAPLLAWNYGSGFPKSLDVSKAIDKAAGAEREVIDVVDPRGTFDGCKRESQAVNTNWRDAENRDDVRDLSRKDITAPATEAARQWQGWGTALKPAWEPIIVARKPLIGTVADNVQAFGTGAINIDACRIPVQDGDTKQATAGKRTVKWGVQEGGSTYVKGTGAEYSDVGRWPANVVTDGSDEVLELFPYSKGQMGDVKGTEKSQTGQNGIYGTFDRVPSLPKRKDSGSAARFFYCAKASSKERDEGLSGEKKHCGMMEDDYSIKTDSGNLRETKRINTHPSVKPLALMRWLCKLVTPPSGTVLDPFMGSGTTGKAAILEGFDFIGVEMEDEYFQIAKARIESVTKDNK